jgi:hypothetical protein
MIRMAAAIRRVRRAARSVLADDSARCQHDEEISRKLDLLMQAQTGLLKAVTVQLERIRPSRLAWAQAGFLLVVSAVAASSFAIWTAQASSISSQVSAMHEQANADRTQALQDLLPSGDFTALVTATQLRQDLARPERLRSMLAQARVGTNLQAQADSIDAQADRYEAGTSDSETEAQVGLTVSSAFFGSVLGWIITQSLAELRWRRRVRPGSAKNA